MKTKGFKKTAIMLTTSCSLLLAVACQKNLSSQQETTGGQSSVKIYLTDDPSLVFDKVLLDIQKIEIKVEDDAQEKHEREHQNDVDDNDHHGDQSGGWRALSIHAGIYDILRFRNGLDTLFASDTFPAAHKLKKLRVTLGTNNSVVYNGSSFPLSLKGNDNFIVVKLEESAVNINAGGLSSIWIDVDAGRSIKKNGNQFELKPSVKLFSKESTGGVEGRVLPKDAAAVVMAINGTDTASAKPESEGEFKFKGLKAGTYSFLYHATANNYRDTTIRNIIVKTKEDTKLPVITMRK
jgi:Domain of unknown function (DUF4382)